ncbi:hypothetical protein [Castellaniella sp. MT123]|uniref:hypothetical protein n=1 Tax=Castellaniella sp. MT123 TaxID=3140381 RepID=UPI0031F33E33
MKLSELDIAAAAGCLQQWKHVKSSGRYRLGMAAHIIAAAVDSPYTESRINALMESALSGELAVYLPDEPSQRYRHDPNIPGAELRRVTMEAKPEDLNAWIRSHEPGNKFRFERPPAEDESDPLWKRDLALWRTLNHVQAACVLMGLDPYDRSSYLKSERMRDTVLKAIEDGEIEFEHSGMERGDVILAKSLAAWCDRNGIPWPLPWNFEETQEVTEAELRHENNSLRRSLTAAQEKVERLESEVSGLNSRISSDNGYVDKYEAKILRLESELAQAKISHPNGDATFSTDHKLLKQIGALALLLSEKSSRYKSGDKPNGSQIAAGVDDIVKAMPDANARGLGDSSIRASISEGLKLLAS